MALVNIVGVSNVTTDANRSRLQTFGIAGAWITNENEDTYSWVLQQLRSAIWPEQEILNNWRSSLTSSETELKLAETNQHWGRLTRSSQEDEMAEAIEGLKNYLRVPGELKENEKLCIKHLEKMLKEKEKWVGCYCNQYAHLETRTSNRVESFHNSIKRAIGQQSSGGLAVTARRIHLHQQESRSKMLQERKSLPFCYGKDKKKRDTSSP
ncbi:uncharacterized protein B0P05DRAFT_617468 [Gilbertella persicaria]|uniref:uncharacterized protein n=1 Tax=Gilbertella persicaria TaxID=101096 RepID=UPI002220B1FA|nr:uncharacterized protein B0P05DRAFT_617468 [Gilbertella persicaria]KAI8074239.1 hypothetical protein B0P05DRAFT_617468 [Gilbertella persicaria]